MRIQVEFDDTEVRRMLQRLIDAGINPRPALLEIGEELVDSTQKRFESESGPDGVPWVRNSELTKSRKGDRDQPLTGDGALGKEIYYDVIGGDTLEVGSVMEYAATQQFGAKQGQFGRSDRNTPLPWGDIPARPFIGISDADEEVIIKEINKFLQDQID